jgi:small subunit ribosomal protein S16
MLVIRLQRTGRKGHAMFRIVVQDSRRTPSSGKVVAQLGSYDPHAKIINIDKEKTSKYLSNGAQPSERMVSLLKSQSIELPAWVKSSSGKQKAIKNPDKRRSTAPAKDEENKEESIDQTEDDKKEIINENIEVKEEDQEKSEES